MDHLNLHPRTVSYFLQKIHPGVNFLKGFTLVSIAEIGNHFTPFRPHGPNWILSSDVMTDGAILVHFNEGSIDLDVPVIFLPGEGTDKVIVGKLSENHSILSNVVEAPPKNVIDWNCIKFPEVEDLRTRLLESNQIYKLPFKVNSETCVCQHVEQFQSLAKPDKKSSEEVL